MDATRQFFGKGQMDEAMAVDAALADKGCRYYVNSEVGFTPLSPAGMAGMLV